MFLNSIWNFGLYLSPSNLGEDGSYGFMLFLGQLLF